MDSNGTAIDFEKYKLNVEINGEKTVQYDHDSTTGRTISQTWRRARPLGHGAFGEVLQQVWRDQHRDLHYRAVKVCSERSMQAKQVDYKRELSTLAAFSNSKYAGFFVNLHGWWIESGNIFIAMEYLSYGDLSNYATSDVSEAEIREISDNVLRGLEVMHQLGYTHRDIKPQNVLVVQKRPEFCRWWVKIADFGISKQVLEGSGTGLHTTVGTMDYCAPEVQQLVAQDRDTYNNKVDMWSLGCVLFNIGTQGHIPFSGLDLMRYCEGLIAFNPKNLPIRLSDDGVSFVKALLQSRPERRPSATRALQHPWMAMGVDLMPSNRGSALQPKSCSSSRQALGALPNPLLPTASSPDLHQRNPNPQPAMASPAQRPLAANKTAEPVSMSPPNKHKEESNERPHASHLPPTKTTKTNATQAPITSSDHQGVTPSESMPNQAVAQQPQSRTGMNGSVASASSDSAQQKLTSGLTRLAAWLKRNEDELKTGGTWSEIPLHLAVYQWKMEIAKLLVEHGANIHAKDQQGRTPLHSAAGNGYLKLAKWLKDQGADIHARDHKNWTPLHCAMWTGCPEVLVWLKDQGADINARTSENWIPLHLAIWGGHVEVIKWLKDQGANIHEKGENDLNSLQIAAYIGHLEVAKLLTQLGADVNEEDKHSSRPTALSLAVQQGHLDTAKWLKEQGANMDTLNKQAYSLLHIAASNGHLDMVKWLNEQGASIDGKTTDGLTAQKLAEIRGHNETAGWLRDQVKEVVKEPAAEPTTEPVSSLARRFERNSVPVSTIAPTPVSTRRPVRRPMTTVPSTPRVRRPSSMPGRRQIQRTSGVSTPEPTLGTNRRPRRVFTPDPTLGQNQRPTGLSTQGTTVRQARGLTRESTLEPTLGVNRRPVGVSTSELTPRSSRRLLRETALDLTTEPIKKPIKKTTEHTKSKSEGEKPKTSAMEQLKMWLPVRIQPR